MLKFDSKQWTGKAAEIESILNGTSTGVVFTNVLSEVQCDELIEVIEQLKSSFYTDLNSQNGFSLPSMFGQLFKNQPPELVNKYFNDVRPFLEAVNNASGKAIDTLIQNTLTDAFAPYTVKVLERLLPYSFRIVFPDRGGLFMHKDGNLLPYVQDVISDDIEAAIFPETMMSWFFTLQKPASGGELWVADSSCGSYEKDGEYHFRTPAGDIIEANEAMHIVVPTPKGSLLMFKGGEHWHKVVPPASGDIYRITLGGFMALGRNSNEIFYWS